MNDWLRENIYNGETTLEILKWLAEMGLLAAALVLLVGLPFAIPADKRRKNQRSNGRRVKGSTLLTTRQFNRMFHSDGIGWMNEAEPTFLKRCTPWLRIPLKSEANHVLIAGTTGAGKTTLIVEALIEIERREQPVVLYDPDGFFLNLFYRPERGDVILNPMDARGAYWNPGNEVRGGIADALKMAEALTVAGAFFPTFPEKASEAKDYFHDGAKKVLARLLTFNPTPEELTHWMSYPEEIERRLTGTPQAQILSKSTGQLSGILGQLAKGADSFALLVTANEAKQKSLPHWNSRLWTENSKGWIFLTSQNDLRDAIRPISSMWFDLCVQRILSRDPSDRTPVWCVLDELASLNYLPQLHTALTEARRSNLRLIVGFQDKAQIETRYGNDASVLLGMPKTKIYLRAGENSAAKWASDNLGEIEVERISESWTYGERRTRTETLQRTTEKLVLPSEMTALPDRHGYLQHEGHVVPFSFPYRVIPAKAEPKPFMERDLPAPVLLPSTPPEAPQTEQELLPHFS
jgi:type IV secretory pathway TraG/TraD family ATPase VirD4